MRKLLLAAGLALVVTALVVVPLPLLAVAPGPTLALTERVSFGDEEVDDVSGRLLLTAVRLEQVSAAGAVVAWADRDRDLLFRQQVVPAGVDEDEFDQQQRRLFQESTRVAAAVGLRAAGHHVEITGDGARVESVFPNGPADGHLQRGDIITAVDGEEIAVAADLVEAVSAVDAGDELALQLRRGDERETTTVEVGDVARLDRPAVGVTVRTAGLEVSLPFEVEVDLEEERLGGPSGGLMTALAVFDLADPGDLTRGRAVAGTGTIAPDGGVGRVGGVEQKVRAARDGGASVFLVPEDEATAARGVAGDVRIVAVATLDEALRALQDRD